MCLVKPQFECGPDIVRRGRGVVRDPADRQAAVDAIVAFAREELSDCTVVDDAVESPVHDKLGNREFLLRLRRSGAVDREALEAAAALPSAMPGVAPALAATTPGIAAAADASGGNPDQGAIVAYAWFAISAVAGVKGIADKLRTD